jgi:hypothetical protein
MVSRRNGLILADFPRERSQLLIQFLSVQNVIEAGVNLEGVSNAGGSGLLMHEPATIDNIFLKKKS